MARRTRAHPLTRELQRALLPWVSPGEGLLIAVSGGADSTALLEGMAELRETLGVRLEVVTVDHGLRPEAASEVEAVLAQAARLGVPAEVRALEMTHGPGVEARARRLRETAFEAVRRARGLRWILTAHTADDQAETVLMRLARGAGLRGAAGILPRKGHLLRPLLGVTRAQVIDYLAAREVAYKEDPMNADPAFFRVRVRRSLLPALIDAAGPAAALQLSGFAARAAADHALLKSLADDARRRLRLEDGSLDLVGLRALLPPLRVRVLAALIEEGGVTPDHGHLARAEEAIVRGGHVALSRTLSLRTEGGRVRLVARGLTATPAPYTLAPGQVTWDAASGLELRVQTEPVADAWSLPLPESAFPLTVRRRRRGDLLRFGKAGRALQDLLVNAKVPAERRDLLPVIVDAAGQALAVAGLWPTRAPGQEKWRLVARIERNPSDRAGTGL